MNVLASLQLLFALLGLVAMAPTGNDSLVKNDSPKQSDRKRGDLMRMWHDYKQKYKKSYTNEEDKSRFVIFKETLASVEKNNMKYSQKKVAFKTKLGMFSDWTPEELNRLRGTNMNIPWPEMAASEPYSAIKNIEVAKSFDWRLKGAVTPAKLQGDCGSCWSFVVTGAIETQLFTHTGKLISLSEQQLVDCDKVNLGCNGGAVELAFQYVKNIGGIEPSVRYPYVSHETEVANPQCRFNKTFAAATITGFKFVRQTSEDLLKKIVSQLGPVAVIMYASDPEFVNYESGIYENPECSTSKLDHAVLVIGYGEEEDIPYWIVKNSWSKDWGDDGFGKIRAKGNICGILTQFVYPTGVKSLNLDIPKEIPNAASCLFLYVYLYIGLFIYACTVC